jgi:hypothetical protein
MKPMKSLKLITWDWLLDGGRQWLSAGRAARWAFLVLSLAAGLRVAAQQQGPPGSLDDNMSAEALGRLSNLVQSADSAQLDEMALPDDPTSTNGMPQPDASGLNVNRLDSSSRSESTNRFQSSSRSPIDDRRSRGRRSRSRSDRPGSSGSANDYSRGTQPDAVAGTNAGPPSLDYAAFKVIVDKNIFDPNRFPRGPGVRVRSKPRSVDSLTLVGTMTYEKGTFAFFDGTSSEYKKALKLADTIAGYRVTNIAPNGVKLVSGTNELALSVGAQLRREEDGPWLLGRQAGPYSDTPASTSASAAPATTVAPDTAPSGPDSDVLKKLMERRAKE